MKLLLYKIIASSTILEIIKENIIKGNIKKPYSFLRQVRNNEFYIVQPNSGDRLDLGMNVMRYSNSRPTPFFVEKICIQEKVTRFHEINDEMTQNFCTYSSDEFFNCFKWLMDDNKGFDCLDIYYNYLYNYFKNEL